MKVSDLMSTDLVTLGADDPVIAAEEMMGLRRFRHLPVVDKGYKLVGLVTHRDLLRVTVMADDKEGWRENLARKARTKAREIMHTHLRTVDPDEELVEAARLLREHKYGCLPVTEDDGKLVGLLTEADFLRCAEVLLRHMSETEPAYLESVKGDLKFDGP